MANQKYKREIKPKKSLGQHFLTDEGIAIDIAESLMDNGLPVLEIGPGTGALTKHLLNIYPQVSVVEIDTRSIAYLREHYPELIIYEEDFLQMDMETYYPNGVNIIGNFPYHISSQIVFKVLENAHVVPQFAGMFQKEVAQRICAKPKTKQYGQLTLLREMYYQADYLFDVPQHAFDPPPKVMSGVLRMKYDPADLGGVEVQLLKRVIKSAFLHRRKKMRNTLKSFFTTKQLQDTIFDKRPEELGLNEFVGLVQNVNNG